MINISIEKNDLWTTSVFSCEFPEYDKIKASLRDFIYTVELQKPENDMDQIGPHDQPHKKDLLESWPSLFEDNSSNEFNSVKNFCCEITLDIARKTNSPYTDVRDWKLDVKESWYHITKDRGYHDYHSHSNSSWCGIFYVDIGNSNLQTQNGVNRFYTPLSVPVLATRGQEYIDHSFCDIEPKDGKLIVFPGYLPHSAVLYTGDTDRIVIAFNAEIV